jgi:hypothetical protein
VVRNTFTRDQIGTRYMMAVVRTLANPDDPADVTVANALQDKIQVQQAASGRFAVPNWDSVAQGKIRNALLVLAGMSGATTERRFGARAEVDPIHHLLFTAAG